MLKGKLVSLIPLEERHLQNTLIWVNNREIMLKINRVSPVTMQDHREWYARNTADPSITVFAIETGNGAHVGNCALKDIDSRSRKAELWIYLGLENTGRHFGEEAVKIMLEYGFRDLDLNRIYLYVLDSNPVGQKFFKKTGFTVEGVFRQDVFLDGKYHDTIRMGLLRTEWLIRSDCHGKCRPS